MTWNLTAMLCLIWALTLLYGEMLAFRLPSLFSCSWPHLSSQMNGVLYPDDFVKVAVLADPQLMDRTSLSVAPNSLALEIAQFYTDVFMRRAFLSSVLPFEPDVILFLGDYFDGGPDLSDEEWQESLSRLRHIFDLDTLDSVKHIKVYHMPGNHDVGYSAFHSRIPQVFRRYENAFGTRNYRFKVGGLDFIAIDAQTLDGHPQRDLTSATWNFVQNVSTDSSSTPRVLLTHIPLYRKNGTSCGPNRSSQIIDQRVRRDDLDEDILYQNYITEEKTETLLDSLRPVLVLSGHDHDQCTVAHTSKYGPVTEQTLGTISWQQGNLYPSFMLLSAWNHSFPNATIGKDAVLTQLCFLPVQTYIYIWYLCQFVLTLLLALFWPTSGVSILTHVDCMVYVRSLNFNIFKGSKEKVDEENCEYDMVWDAEGSMHLVKRTVKAVVSSNEKGTAERGNAVMRLAAKKQLIQDEDVLIPSDASVYVPIDASTKIASRPNKSKTDMAIRRIFRTLRVITVVAAVNLPIYMFLLFKDWIDK
ncbi:uncharacterized protein C630.12 isoform X2 [Apium graveolens]|uniref:uncharacterized protein C630.12 isoform X2 n=1 Tax=Apium graveolens TaxID=4045 RepID=UPI003D791CF1